MALIWLLNAAIFIFYAFTFLKLHYSRTKQPCRSARESRRLLRDSTLAERAVPNKRLVTAFGIDNAFTTIDSEYHKTFVDSVRGHLKPTVSAWINMAEQTSQALQQVKNESKSIRLEKLVQMLVIRAVIQQFFQLQPGTAIDVGKVTSSINSLWVSSKSLTNDRLDSAQRQQRADLMTEMQKLAKESHDNSIHGRHNPLNIILPAYETMWRVILRCFLELKFRSDDTKSHQYQTIMAAFLKDPSPAAFHALSTSDLSGSNIVSESLRLYPPTRRIYRQTAAGLQSVDVERLHRDYTIWGPNTMSFRPERWVEATKEQKEAFMPFGSGKFECPAKPLFGPMLIGIIVAVLVTEIGDDFELEGEGCSEVMEQATPLHGGRHEYSDLHLRGD